MLSKLRRTKKINNILLRLEEILKNSDLEKVYDPNFIYHFGIWIDKRKVRTYLDRDNYCIIDRKSYIKVPAYDEVLNNWDEWKEQKKTLKFEGVNALIPPPRIKI